MEKPQTLSFFRRNLPHWLVADKAYFVTIRLHGTLPKGVVAEMREQRRLLIDEAGDQRAVSALHRKQFVRIEQLLDAQQPVGCGLCHWVVGNMLMDNLEWLRKRGWVLYAFVLMSTHLHMLLRSGNGRTNTLVSDLDKFKCYTGRKANELLGTSGRFWARDLFDHWVRNADSFDGFVRYIVNNPVKAGLVNEWQNWRWTVVDEAVGYAVGAAGRSPAGTGEKNAAGHSPAGTGSVSNDGIVARRFPAPGKA